MSSIALGRISGNAVNTSFIHYKWSASGNQSIAASTQTALLASNFSVAKQTGSNILVGCFTGSTFTAPVTGTYTITWYGRMNLPSTSALMEYWLLVTGSFSSQLSHMGGPNIFCAPLCWKGNLTQNDQVSFIGFSTVATAFGGSNTGDHTISIDLQGA